MTGADNTLLRWQRLSVSPALKPEVRADRLRLVAHYLERRDHFDPYRQSRCAEAGIEVTPVRPVDLSAFKGRIRACLVAHRRQLDLQARAGTLRHAGAGDRLKAALRDLRRARSDRAATCDQETVLGL